MYLDISTLNPALNVTVIKDVPGLQKLKDFFSRNKSIGFDVETDPKKDYYWRKCRLIQFGTVQEQIVVDLLDLCDGNADLLFEIQGDYGKNLHKAPKVLELFSIISPILTSKDWLKVGVTLSFEYMTMYWNFGVRCCGFWDCSVVEKVIWAGAHSLKDYGYFSMSEMFDRYFGYEIEKELQESFTLDGVLTTAQYTYAALDTRIPFAIKAAQELVVKGYTRKTHNSKIFQRIDEIVTGDNLEEVCKIENDAIGAFQDMHIHGERIDTTGWKNWIKECEVKLKETIVKLDEIFIPIVGSVDGIVTQQQVDDLEFEWKNLRNVTPEELELKKLGKKDPSKKEEAARLEINRKLLKEKVKKDHLELRRKRAAQLEVAEVSEGKALINYGSPDQLLEALQTVKEFKKLKSTGDDVLETWIPSCCDSEDTEPCIQHHDSKVIRIVKTIQRFRQLNKILSTYGMPWTTQWTTHPCKEEGWLHPGDGRIHHVYNQQDAETGRSSSDSPNGQNLPPDPRKFYIVDEPDEIAPEGYVYLTADMSGAELRIIAEESGATVWIEAFSRGEDVHSVGTELLFPEEWPKLALPDCAYYKLKTNGEPARQKCKCPGHIELRNGNKSTNFLLAYGGREAKLAREIKKSIEYARNLMEKHERKNKEVWDYLENSGKEARIKRKSFDPFGRRRLFPKASTERAIIKAKDEFKEKLKLPDEVRKENIKKFVEKYGRKPDKGEKLLLSNRLPTVKEITKAEIMLEWGCERQGKNHRIQGANASIAKIAMAILWHELPKYHAQLKKMVHDELVIMCPERYATQVAELVGKAFRDAAARHMKKVVMEFDYKVAKYWKK